MASTSSRATQPTSGPDKRTRSSEPDWIASQLSLAASDLLDIADRSATTRSSSSSHLARIAPSPLPVSPSLGSLLGEEGQRGARLTPVHDDRPQGGEAIQILLHGKDGNGSANRGGRAGTGSDDEEEDDHLPAARLSYLIASVRPGAGSSAARGIRSSAQDQDDDDEGDNDEIYDHPSFLAPHHGPHLNVPSSSSSSSSADSLSRRPRSPLYDGMWLNEKGERIVNGQVVGRLSLVRPSPHSARVDFKEAQGEVHNAGQGEESSRDADFISAGTKHQGYSTDSDLTGRSGSSAILDEGPGPAHAQSIKRRGDPPAFFLQHFPAPSSLSNLERPNLEGTEAEADGNEEGRGRNEEDQPDKASTGASVEHGATTAESAAPASSAPKPSTLLTEQEPQPLRPTSFLAVEESRAELSSPPLSTSTSARAWQPSALLAPSTAAPALAEVQRSTTEPVRLHGNRRAAERAGDVSERVVEAGPSRSSSAREASSQGKGRERGKDRGAPSPQAMQPERRIPFLERAAGLFNAGLVPSREEARGTASSSRPSRIRTRGWADEGVTEAPIGDAGLAQDEEEDGGRDRTLEDLDISGTGTDEGREEEDNSSLISLPVSTHTASSNAPSSLAGAGARRLSRSNSGRSGRSSISSGGGGSVGPTGGPNASARRPGHARRRSSAGSATSVHNLEGPEEDVEEPSSRVEGTGAVSGGARKKTTSSPPLFRDVRVRGWNLVGDKRKGWICFTVVVVTAQGTSITLHRRYSSFVSLRGSIITELSERQRSSSSSRNPDDASKLVPPLPPRHSGGALGIGLGNKEDAKHLERRRKGLQKWLSDVLLHQRMGRTESVKEWVVGG